MRIRLLTAIAFAAMAILSCSEDTDSIGSSLTQTTDQLKISTGIYQATSKSMLADSVYARNFDYYIGLVKDPETDTYVKNEFMTQFNMLEGLTLPEKEQITTVNGGEVVADSCELWLYFDKPKCYGDSLTPIKMRVLELNEAMESAQGYAVAPCPHAPTSVVASKTSSLGGLENYTANTNGVYPVKNKRLNP